MNQDTVKCGECGDLITDKMDKCTRPVDGVTSPVHRACQRGTSAKEK
jgi:hypothetical protein